MWHLGDAVEAMSRRQLLLHVAWHVGHICMHMLHMRIVHVPAGNQILNIYKQVLQNDDDVRSSRVN